MNPPNEFDLKTQYYQGCGNPITSASYGNTRAALAQFAYPCRPCCPSIHDIANPACRIGGEYYHSLSDVNSYDHDGYTLPWWGSAQKCATNCGWWQGLPSADRPPFATQPALNLRRDYEHLNPFDSQTNFPPNRTRAPFPGALPCQQAGQQSCGCGCGPEQHPTAYMKYYASRKGNKKPIQKWMLLALANDYAHWTRDLVHALRSGNANQIEASFQRLVRTHQQLATIVADGDEQVALTEALHVLARQLGALVRAQLATDVDAYTAARTKLYEQGDLAAATLNTSQDAWRRYLRFLLDQIEAQNANASISAFDAAQKIVHENFISQ